MTFHELKNSNFAYFHRYPIEVSIKAISRCFRLYWALEDQGIDPKGINFLKLLDPKTGLPQKSSFTYTELVFLLNQGGLDERAQVEPRRT